jgi:heat-inducible transcriptional repressor
MSVVHDRFVLSDRQGQVLQAVVSSWVGGAAPVASETVADVLPVRLSPQSVRNTLGELTRLGLVSKPHRSAGRVPTDLGLRCFVDQLLPRVELGPFEKRELADRLESGRGTGIAEVAARVLSERTHQLGFMRAPRLDGLVLRHVSFVRVSSERVMAVLVSEGGRAIQRVLEEPGQGDQAELDRMAAALNERVAGQSLRSVREQFVREAAALRSQADALLARVLSRETEAEHEGLVVGTRLVVLEQPEFQDPDRLRALLRTVEEKERLVTLVDQVVEGTGVRIAISADLSEASLDHCALVAAAYGRPDAPLGALGVIGPNRMDYARVVPLVGYMSRLLTGMLEA